MKVNWNLVVDVVVALVGIYVLMNGIWMKSTGKTSSLLATPEELKNAPGAATPKGHIAIELQTHYVTDEKKSQTKI